jgi:hypothetical protein
VPSVQSASLPGVNVPQPVESSSLETAAAASTNVSNMGLHDPEKSETKGRNDVKYSQILA